MGGGGVEGVGAGGPGRQKWSKTFKSILKQQRSFTHGLTKTICDWSTRSSHTNITLSVKLKACYQDCLSKCTSTCRKTMTNQQFSLYNTTDHAVNQSISLHCTRMTWQSQVMPIPAQFRITAIPSTRSHFMMMILVSLCFHTSSLLHHATSTMPCDLYGDTWPPHCHTRLGSLIGMADCASGVITGNM